MYEDIDDEEYYESEPQELDFQANLTVKNGVLTVADDFLKNDGNQFLDLMEHLAQKKMLDHGNGENWDYEENAEDQINPDDPVWLINAELYENYGRRSQNVSNICRSNV